VWFVLDDLAAQGDEQIRHRPLPIAAMLTALSLLGFPRREALGVLRQMAQLFTALPPTHGGAETLAAVVCYLFEVAKPEPDPEQVRRFFEANVSKTVAEVAMSTADKLRQQGREVGFAEGKAQGKAEGEAKGEAKGQVAGRAALLLSQLTLKFGEPSDETKRRVTGATIEQLDAFAARVLSAQAPGEVFETGPIGRPRVVQARRSTSKARKKR
jgi:hypothetical protein